MRLYDAASFSELPSIIIKAALISEALVMSEAASKDSFNEAASIRLSE